MKEKNETGATSSLPLGWPENLPLPTEQEVEDAVKRGEKRIREMEQTSKDKVRRARQETLNISIDI